MLPVIFRGHTEAGFFAHALGFRSGSSPLSFLPGNHRTQDARYACLIVVKDYFRLRCAPSIESRDWHYSHIEPAILEDVRARRAVLVFDLSNEGPAYDAEIFNPLYSWIEGNKLPAGRCIWLAQNRKMAATAAAIAGPRAALIKFEHYDYFVKLMAWKFSLADPDAIGFDSTSYLNRLADVGAKDRLMLCLNATPRLARVLTVAALHHHKLMNESLVSFPGMSYVKSGASLSQVLTFVDNNPNLEYLRSSIHLVDRMPPLRVDAFPERGNQLVEKIDCSGYERTFFSLVTESDFSEQGIARVTEKTVKAFCMGHPALILGNTHSIDIMRGFGFQDWCSVIDRSAESIASPAVRFALLMTEVLRQAQCIKADPKGWISAIRDVSIRNYRYAVSGGFLSHYIDAFDNAIVARMIMMVAG